MCVEVEAQWLKQVHWPWPMCWLYHHVRRGWPKCIHLKSCVGSSPTAVYDTQKGAAAMAPMR